uniref:Uncharacterized protein n=1 Tax=Romanomermis culicivorax TaxID=13658 RepID=A0A915I7N3_ROMCU
MFGKALRPRSATERHSVGSRNIFLYRGISRVFRIRHRPNSSMGTFVHRPLIHQPFGEQGVPSGILFTSKTLVTGLKRILATFSSYDTSYSTDSQNVLLQEWGNTVGWNQHGFLRFMQILVKFRIKTEFDFTS